MPMADLCFFTPSRPLSVTQAAEFVGATLRQSALGSRNITALSALDQAHASALTFIHDKKHGGLLPNLVAAAILCSEEFVPQIPHDVAVLVSAHPQRDFSALGRLLFPQSVQPMSILGESGISPLAYIHPEADLEEGVTVEAGASIGRGVEIGTGTLVGAGAVIGAHCKIGRHSIISAHVSLQYALIGDRVHLHPGVRVGQDGFGYVSGERGIEKVPQLGRVVIQDDVEIGANSTIDRGALRDTIIGEGTKIDNLVQIAHNVRIGRHCLIAAHCGFSGSVTIGDMTRIGGDVGVADHIKIGSHVQIAAASGVMNNIPDGEKWGGSPARPFKQWFREVAALRSISRGEKEKE